VAGSISNEVVAAAAEQDAIHTASRRTQTAVQAAMHRTYEYLISLLDAPASSTDHNNTGLCLTTHCSVLTEILP